MMMTSMKSIPVTVRVLLSQLPSRLASHANSLRTVSISVFRDDNAADEAYAPDDRERSHSSSATAVDSSDSSFTGSSASTLQVDSIAFREDSIAQLKEAVRYTSPILRTKSPPPVGTPRSKRSKMMMPFAPEELARALNAVQLVCT